MFVEGRIVAAVERAEDLVGRDVVEAEGVLRLAGQRGPVFARRFEQDLGADDIGADEFGRAVVRAVDMGFGGEVHDPRRVVRREGRPHGGGVADIGVEVDVARVAPPRAEALGARRIGHAVDVHHHLIGRGQQPTHDGRADEA